MKEREDEEGDDLLEGIPLMLVVATDRDDPAHDPRPWAMSASNRYDERLIADELCYEMPELNEAEEKVDEPVVYTTPEETARNGEAELRGKIGRYMRQYFEDKIASEDLRRLPSARPGKTYVIEVELDRVHEEEALLERLLAACGVSSVDGVIDALKRLYHNVKESGFHEASAARKLLSRYAQLTQAELNELERALYTLATCTGSGLEDRTLPVRMAIQCRGLFATPVADLDDVSFDAVEASADADVVRRRALVRLRDLIDRVYDQSREGARKYYAASDDWKSYRQRYLQETD